jgi:hypothetical protein
MGGQGVVDLWLFSYFCELFYSNSIVPVAMVSNYTIRDFYDGIV